MEGSEYMYSAAEVGVALAGFAALVIAIRQRAGSPLSDTDRVLVASLVEFLPIPLDDNLGITLASGYAMKLLWNPG